MSIQLSYSCYEPYIFSETNPFNDISENQESEVNEDTINMRTLIAKINANFNAGFPKNNNLKTENTNHHEFSPVVHPIQKATEEKSS